MPYILLREWIDSIFGKDNSAADVKSFINGEIFYLTIAFLGSYAKDIIGTKMVIIVWENKILEKKSAEG